MSRSPLGYPVIDAAFRRTIVVLPSSGTDQAEIALLLSLGIWLARFFNSSSLWTSSFRRGPLDPALPVCSHFDTFERLSCSACFIARVVAHIVAGHTASTPSGARPLNLIRRRTAGPELTALAQECVTIAKLFERVQSYKRQMQIGS